MRVEFLHYAECPSHEEALARLRAAMAAEGVEPHIHVVEVKSEEQAQELRFIGSPTIRINDEDIDREGLAGQPYGLTCRVYRRSDGRPSPLPETSLIRRRLREARQ